MAEIKYEYVADGLSNGTYVAKQLSLPMLKVKKMREGAILPTKGHNNDAGIDLYACLDHDYIVISPGETVMFGSGIACEFPEGYWGMVVPRSSVGIKKRLNIPQGAAVIDEGFVGEIMLAFYNHGDTNQIIENGERIAQMILLPYYLYDVVEVKELHDTERGSGGIGSTGKF